VSPHRRRGGAGQARRRCGRGVGGHGGEGIDVRVGAASMVWARRRIGATRARRRRPSGGACMWIRTGTAGALEAAAGIAEGRWRGEAPPVDGVPEYRRWQARGSSRAAADLSRVCV
jgi:hypothetical protein